MSDFGKMAEIPKNVLFSQHFKSMIENYFCTPKIHSRGLKM